MATAALVSIAEYLSTSYRPDLEMLEGQLVERNAGEYDHSNLQGALVACLRPHRIDDYRAFGVPQIWILDRVKRRAYVCMHGDFREPEGEVLEIPGSPIRIPLRALFDDLD